MASAELLEMLSERYDEQEVIDALIADIEKHGTEERIVGNELVLPSPEDAQMWHERQVHGRVLTETERGYERRLAALEERVGEGGRKRKEGGE